jgi:hypothetical protein
MIQVKFSVRRPSHETVGSYEESSQIGTLLESGGYDAKPAAPARAQRGDPSVIAEVK